MPKYINKQHHSDREQGENDATYENEEEIPNTDLESVAKPAKIEADLEDVKEQVSPYSDDKHKELNRIEKVETYDDDNKDDDDDDDDTNSKEKDGGNGDGHEVTKASIHETFRPRPAGFNDTELIENRRSQKLNVPPDTRCTTNNKPSKDEHQCTSPNTDLIKPLSVQMHVIPARLNKNSSESLTYNELVTFIKQPDLPLPNNDFRNEVIIPLYATLYVLPKLEENYNDATTELISNQLPIQPTADNGGGSGGTDDNQNDDGLGGSASGSSVFESGPADACDP